MKIHIKKDDTVKVIAGSYKGKTGRVMSVDREKYRAVVEGVNVIKVHAKPSATNPDGGIVEKEGTVHISNLMLVDKNGDVTRVGRMKNAEGKTVRYSKKSKDKREEI
ncbi:50S ribosomal protein L24 [bacterium SCSIO 12741]|nr:50S ribosomal protein L24 [bacterium SCSIO 12741]